MILKNTILAIIMLLSCHLSGQTFRFGAISGLNISKLSGNSNSSYNHFGFKFGGRVGVDLHRQLRTSIDLLYSRKGNTVSLNPSTIFFYENIKLDYVEVPFMITFMDWMDDPDEEDYYKLHFTIGTSLSKLVNYQVKNNSDRDVTDLQLFNENKISVLGGLVYYPNQYLGINLQYSYAFSNLQKNKLSPKMKSRTWSLNLIFMLNNKRSAS